LLYTQGEAARRQSTGVTISMLMPLNSCTVWQQ